MLGPFLYSVLGIDHRLLLMLDEGSVMEVGIPTKLGIDNKL